MTWAKYRTRCDNNGKSKGKKADIDEGWNIQLLKDVRENLEESFHAFELDYRTTIKETLDICKIRLDNVRMELSVFPVNDDSSMKNFSKTLNTRKRALKHVFDRIEESLNDHNRYSN